MKAKDNSTKRESRKKGLKRAYAVLIGAAAVFCIATVLVTPILLRGTSREATIKIPKDASRKSVRDSLSKYFGKDYAAHVDRLLKIRDIDFSKRHGAYLIKEGTSPMMTVKTLTRSAQTPVKLTINGFRGLPQLAEAISRKMDFSAEEFTEAATNPALLKEYGLNPEQALSLFLEDTYEVYWSHTPEEVIRKIGKSYQKFWDLRNNAKLEGLGLTSAADAMIIASITDEETNKGSEKGRIGRLYANRLKNGMRLQADPTVKFALQDFSIKRITKAMTRHESPYNTYVNFGLPPGPIRTTSTYTLTKILNSPPSEDLYMCANEDFSGFHVFAKNYEEHMKNARRYQEVLNRMNIK